MPGSPYQPLLQLTRGDTVESIHYGAIAIVDADGRLVTQHGDPNAITFLRSTAKPFQALPFIEAGGTEFYDLLPAEIAVICASHSGTDEHVKVISALQVKTGVQETDLLCGVHEPIDEATAQAMRLRGEAVTPNRHNCSGKHTGMLAYARMQGWSTTEYLDPSHPVQENILRMVAEMCDLAPGQVFTGTDGCSAPNFAVPLKNAALAYARLSDPSGLPPERAIACRRITAAMASHPDMVGGPGRFDTLLMQASEGKIVSKGGAEGYQGIGILPGVLGPGSPALGIVFKISDGDTKNRARPAVALEILGQLGALTASQMGSLSRFGPIFPIRNWRKIIVGQARPCFELSNTH